MCTEKHREPEHKKAQCEKRMWCCTADQRERESVCDPREFIIKADAHAPCRRCVCVCVCVRACVRPSVRPSGAKVSLFVYRADSLCVLL